MNMQLNWESDLKLKLKNCRYEENSTWPLKLMIMKQRINCTKRWDVSALKTQKWESISSKILTGTGWKSYLRNSIGGGKYEKNTNDMPRQGERTTECVVESAA